MIGLCGRAATRARQWLVNRARSSRDDGFILLESIIAIAVITVVMGAVGAEFVSGVAASSQQRTQQVAVQLADSAVEQIRALDPSDLLTGRDKTSVLAQFAAAPLSVRPWLTPMDQAFDKDPSLAPGSGARASIPTVGVPQTPGPITYLVNEYLGSCSIRDTGSTDCVPSTTLAGVSSVQYLRAVIAVSWSGTGVKCGSSACTYVTSTLVSTDPDSTFRINSAPYSAPNVVALAAQSNAVTDTVSLQMAVASGSGVPPFAWAVTAGSLPTGLALSPTGLISGTIQDPAGSYSATITVTDAFLRTDSAVVTWTVKPAVKLTNPGPQATLTTQNVNLALAATGGDGAPYTYSVVDASLPPGLIMSSAGVITGRPTKTGDYVAKIKVFDKTGTRFGTDTFGWSVSYPPLAISDPGTQVDTINAPITGLQLVAAGGSGTYGWADKFPATLPPGLSISPSGLITGTATSVANYSVTLTVTDTGPNPVTPKSTTATFSWMVVARPTVTSPGNATVSVGAQLNAPLTTTCPNSPCTYVINGGPPGVSITNSGVITGTVGGSATTYANVTISVTDSDNATTTTPAFTVVVKARPTVTAPGAQTDTIGGGASVALTTTCPNSPCTYLITNGPAGLAVSPTGVISGTVGGSAATYNNVTVTVTDAAGATASTSPFVWTVYAQPTISPGAQADTIGATANDAFTTSCPNAPCRYTLNGGPAGVTVNSSGVAVGTVGGSAQTYTGVTVTVTDNDSVAVTSSPFSWVISAAPTLTGLVNDQIGETATPSHPINYTCPAPGACTISFSGTLATASSGALGVGLSTSPVNVNANSSRSVSVSASSGTVYLNGLVSTNAVTSGSSLAYGVTLSITDSNSYTPSASSATYTAYSTPRISTPGVVTVTRTVATSKTLTYACPGTCTVSVASAPSGVGLDKDTSGAVASSVSVSTTTSGTLYLRGTVPTNGTRTSYPITVTITYGTTGIDSTGNWTVQ